VWKCCINREDILLSPKDIYSISKELSIKPEEMFEQYCEVYVGQDSRVPIVRPKPQGSVKRYPLLKNRKCMVHKAKPTVCAMYPIGRCIVAANLKEGLMTGFVKNQNELFSRIKSGDISLFGHFKDLDIWIPFDYDLQTKLEIMPYIEITETFGVDGKAFYEKYALMKQSDGNIQIILSDNLMADLKKNKFFFNAKTDIDGVKKDIDFLQAVKNGHTLTSGNNVICEYTDPILGKDIEQVIRNINDLIKAQEQFAVKIIKRFDKFSNENYVAMDELINFYRGDIRPKDITDWYMWWWDGKVIPMFMAVDSDEKNSSC